MKWENEKKKKKKKLRPLLSPLEKKNRNLNAFFQNTRTQG